jgi:hypothetical protein
MIKARQKTPFSPDALYFDIAGASMLLGPGFQSTTLKRFLRDGTLPHQRVGTRVSISRGDLLTLAEVTRTAPAPEGRARGENGKFTKAKAKRKSAR